MITPYTGIVNERISSLRAILRIIKSEKFEQAVEVATDEQKLEVIEYINENHKYHILKWIKGILDEKTLEELKSEAKTLGLIGYTKKPKNVLFEEIRNVKKEKENGRRTSSA